MAYKITKYAGKHKLKDTKTGKSVDIDIAKFMNGGKDKDKDKKLKSEEVQDIRDTTGIDFTEQGANSLFERRSSPQKPVVPEFNLGRYKDVGYFNVGYQNGEFNLAPTKRNPGNYEKYEKYLDYLQEQNPEAKINRRANQSGYVDFGNRMEYGGKSVFAPQYEEGGCPPGDIECQERQLALYPGINAKLNQQRDAGIAANKNLQTNLADYMANQQVGSTAQNIYTPLNTEQSPQMAAANAFKSPTQSLEDKTLDGFSDDKVSKADPALAAEGEAQAQDPADFTIANPYAGVDIPTAANYLGESIENKDGWGIAASGLKIAAGLGRNIVSGLGRQNRENQVMKKYYEDQKRSRNPIQYVENGGKLQKFAYGGKRDEELATGEFMHGVMNEGIDAYNSEIEKGEYFQTNEGDISEVVGDKHSSGGEKILMEDEDRVLSDKLKLGGKSARELSKKYDIKLKAKNTYSDVLDKYRKKTKLDKIIDEEADVLKKINEQEKVEDATTRDFNLDVLSKKREEIMERKSPIEEQRKMVFDELFNMQEDSKPKSERANDTDELSDGGKKKGAAFEEVPEGQSLTEEGFYGKVSPEQYEKFVKRNSDWFNFTGFDPSKKEDVERLQRQYNEYTGGNKVRVDGKFGEQTASLLLSPPGDEAGVAGVNNDIAAPMQGRLYNPQSPQTTPDVETEDKTRSNGQGLYLFPPESPLPPSSLQGTIKPERRFDRVTPSEIGVEPYLQSLRDNEASQVQSLEGLSPNVRAAVLANMRANSQSQESNTRNQIDTQNINSQEKAIYANARIQSREENSSEADRLAYEQRQYRAQALTDNDISNYYTQLQDINKSRFMDIHNLNLMNSSNEDVYFDGQSYRRKTSDRDLLNKIKL